MSVLRGFVLGVLLRVALCAVEVENHVHILTDQNFDGFVEQHPQVLVEFYAPWCGHCRNLAPQYEEAAERLQKDGGVPLAKVDATVETELGKRFDIRGYPTLKFFRNKEPMDYTGGRTADTIIDWIKSVTGPAVSYITEDELGEDFKGVTFVARVTAKDSAAAKLYEKVADELRLIAKFLAVISKDAKNEVSVYREAEEPITREIGSSSETLSSWVSSERIPLFGPIDGENYAAYEARDQELVWFAATDEEYKKNAAEFRKAAAEFREEYSFVWLDTGRFGNHAREGLGLDELPGVVLRLREGGRFIFPQDKTISGENLISYFKDVKTGKIQKTLKSEPAPEENDDFVKVVVGDTFQEMVFRKNSDTLLEIYAPWCGECKNVEPVYKEFAEKVASNKHLVVMKLDGSANELDNVNYEFDKFPSLFFLKAGEKVPVKRTGGFDLKSLTSFVNEHATKPLDLEKADDEKDEL